ncbi:NAD(P)H nitroreductase [Moritella sp. F3]|uniref:NAD(P)H nitroreductase n=1 Tax=Moritella sp. F3 TaxID=2718882 RepID=UPI0018E0DBB8|nr:NAD(P)H nitroreductase [Moritella sp. F3]GIC77489.1 NAD(P)H nitroreductase [Moritella sp. F1]GIC79950.1 NAD(P)H nitroreductase [Moritella sp. F3]
MDAIDLLVNRHSCNQLSAPAPSGEVLDNIINAGLRVPDHGGLTPWRFIISEGEGLNTLSHYFRDAAFNLGKTEKDVLKATNAPFRAPQIITVIARIEAHAKIPESEQLMSAGCVVMAMQMAAQAQGFNGIWRTGWFAYNDHIKQKLELEEKDEIVGFLYLGTPDVSCKKIRHLDTENFVTRMDS